MIVPIDMPAIDRANGQVIGKQKNTRRLAEFYVETMSFFVNSKSLYLQVYS